MKDILFVTPTISGIQQQYFHLGLLHLASYLKKMGFKVGWFDRDAIIYGQDKSLNDCDRLLLKEIEESKPRIVAFTCYTDYFFDINHVTKLIKKKFDKDVICVVGGVHPTFEPERTLRQMPYVDAVAIGPGYKTVKDLSEKMKLQDIPGIAFKNGSEIVFNPLRKRPPLIKKNHIPDYDLVDHQYYWSEKAPYIFNGMKIRRLAVLTTSTPCPGKCAFCIGDKAKIEHFSYPPGEILEEMEFMVSKYDIRGFWVADRDFFYDRKRALEFCELKHQSRIIKDIPWATTARADQVDDEIASALYESTCVALNIGIESGSDRILKLMHKNVTSDQIIDAVNLLNKHRVPPAGSFIMGLPYQQETDIMANFKLFRKVKLHDSGVQMLMPVVGSEYYDDLVRRGFIDPDNSNTWTDIVGFLAQDNPKRNYSDVPFERHRELFNMFANEVYHTCRKNRQELTSKYGLSKYFDEL